MIKQILHLGKKITKDENIFVQFFSKLLRIVSLWVVDYHFWGLQTIISSILLYEVSDFFLNYFVCTIEYLKSLCLYKKMNSSTAFLLLNLIWLYYFTELSGRVKLFWKLFPIVDGSGHLYCQSENTKCSFLICGFVTTVPSWICFIKAQRSWSNFQANATKDS